MPKRKTMTLAQMKREEQAMRLDMMKMLSAELPRMMARAFPELSREDVDLEALPGPTGTFTIPYVDTAQAQAVKDYLLAAEAANRLAPLIGGMDQRLCCLRDRLIDLAEVEANRGRGAPPPCVRLTPKDVVSDIPGAEAKRYQVAPGCSQWCEGLAYTGVLDVVKTVIEPASAKVSIRVNDRGGLLPADAPLHLADDDIRIINEGTVPATVTFHFRRDVEAEGE